MCGRFRTARQPVSVGYRHHDRRTGIIQAILQNYGPSDLLSAGQAKPFSKPANDRLHAENPAQRPLHNDIHTSTDSIMERMPRPWNEFRKIDFKFLRDSKLIRSISHPSATWNKFGQRGSQASPCRNFLDTWRAAA